MNDVEIEILEFCKFAKTLMEICAQFDISYSSAWQKMGVLVTQGKLKKMKKNKTTIFITIQA